MRVSIKGKRYCRSTRTRDRDQAERFLQRFLAPFGLGERRLPLADVWLEYVKSPNRNELAKSTLENKRVVWMHFAKATSRKIRGSASVYVPTTRIRGESLHRMNSGDSWRPRSGCLVPCAL